jgi:hypothetical protein
MFYKNDYVSLDLEKGVKHTIVILVIHNCYNLYLYLGLHVIQPELLYCVYSILFGVSTIWITRIDNCFASTLKPV